jgi:HK97 gp10 family phage protein
MSDFNHWAQLANALPKATAQVVRKTALDIQSGAISKAPVDTGFLRASIYTVTSQGSTYGKGRASKMGGKFNPAAVHELLPEVEKPPDNQTAYAAVGATYGVYVELGTRHMSAQPYFYPAVEAVKPGFDAALAAIEQKLGG